MKSNDPSPLQEKKVNHELAPNQGQERPNPPISPISPNPANQPTAPNPPRLLGPGHLTKVALKTFILETLWSSSNQQSVGLLTIIDEPLKIIYADKPEALKKARLRNIHYFNTNPIASGLVIGALLRHEEVQAAADQELDGQNNIIQALSSALAAEGDSLFWKSWLPLCCLTAALLFTLTGFIWAPLLIPILFCAFAWPVRFWGVFKGYAMGFDVYKVYKLSHGERIIKAIQWIWLLLLSVLTSLAILKVFTPPNQPSRFSVPWILLSILALWLYVKLSFAKSKKISYLLYPALLVVLFFLTLLFI
ncbi:MAG: PTS system mannose/fructose/sorbose family transporter subunit IID [Deltaproteobacteria bacterium]|jgi:mannose/fructose/N-acetylgalactosamine-specific phosphotransferase system component IID|nr:PTS system mannose/fructose/sorbose family transporter subunit IID [Deltaproteobacteria bacterium]